MNGEVVIVGAGLAGLACARELESRGVPWRVLEAADEPGGRVRTDEIDGFLLDRGFQVLLTAYPEARRVLDYPSLDLHAFEPAALVRAHGRFHLLSDPLRRPLRIPATLAAPVGSVVDQIRVALLVRRLRRGDPADAFNATDTTTETALRDAGLSDRIIERLFRPLFAGIQLDATLGTSSRMFAFVLRMLAEGASALPADGMKAIPEQIAAGLPAERIRYGRRVAEVEHQLVKPIVGTPLEAAAVVVATDGSTAAGMLDDVPDFGSNSVSCVYYAAESPPITEPVLVLDGDGEGPVNNLCVPSVVAPAYAPAGAALVSASVVEDRGVDANELESAVRAQLRMWFGAAVDRWQHLRTYRIPRAQPRQPPGVLEPPQRPVRTESGVYVCGDHRDNASINGALVSGRRAAAAVAADLDR